jgi:hypothetical protein
MAANRLNELGVGAVLRAAEADNSPEAFKRILEVLFIYLGVSTPKGVFTPKARAGKPGRPISNESELIYSTWIEIGKPSLFKNELAQAVYRVTFTKASGTERRKLRDKCRHAVERNLDRELAKVQTELANARKETAELREHESRLREQLAGSKSQKR